MQFAKDPVLSQSLCSPKHDRGGITGIAALSGTDQEMRGHSSSCSGASGFDFWSYLQPSRLL